MDGHLDVSGENFMECESGVRVLLIRLTYFVSFVSFVVTRFNELESH